MAKGYRLAINMIQETDSAVDNNTISEEFSDSEEMHLLKTKVWTRHFALALSNATEELIDLALSNRKGK